MKRTIHYTLIVPTARADDALDALAPVKPKKTMQVPRTDSIWFYLDVAHDQWPHALEVADRYERRQSKEDRLWREECTYTASELKTAEILMARVKRAPRDIPPQLMYDFSRSPSPDCPAPWCWQVKPLDIRSRKFPSLSTGVCATIFGHVLFSESLASELEGVFKPVLKSGKDSGWRQLQSDRQMSPLHESTSGMTEPDDNPLGIATRCDTMEHCFLPVYCRDNVRDILSDRPIVTCSFELFGDQWPSSIDEDTVPPQPRLVLNHAAHRVLSDHKVKSLEYIPVSLI